MSKLGAQREFKNGKAVSEIDPRGEFTIVPKGIKQNGGNWRVIYPDEGIAITQLLVRDGKFKIELLENERAFSVLNAEGFVKMVRLIKTLLPFIMKLNEEYIHRNLTLDKIRIGSDGKVRITDWSSLKHIHDQYKSRAATERHKLIEYGVAPNRVGDLLETYKPTLMDDALQVDFLSLLNDIDDIISSSWGRQHLKKYLRWSRLHGQSVGFTCDRIRAIELLPA